MTNKEFEVTLIDYLSENPFVDFISMLNLALSDFSVQVLKDSEHPKYDLEVRIHEMDKALGGFMREFDLDLIVVSLVHALKEHGKSIHDNEDLSILFNNLAQTIDKAY